jgi:nitroimidazol reductase NimA-like FMN-containing flavoprotein (pyridoxamine 5'-phosphate oxidase superfamily)
MDQLTRDEALQLLNTTPVAHLGLISDGAPYVTPMSFVVDGEEILFRTMAGKKLNALRDNPNVCVEVSQFDEQTGEWASVIVTGTATEVADRNKGERAVQLLFDKYANVLGDPLSRGGLQPMPGLPYLVSLKIEQITGVSSGRGFSPRTRPGRL